MVDALATVNIKGSGGLYLKFKDGDSVKLRILTLDPLVSEKVWDSTPDRVDTKYAFVVWNWDEDRPQIMQVGPGLLRRFTAIHRDEDFDPLNKVDVKISASGEMLERRYEVQVLPKTQTLTNDQLKQAQEIKLEDQVSDSRGRLSQYANDGEEAETTTGSGYAKAKEVAEAIKHKSDEVVDVDPNEDIDLDDIPFN